MTKRERFPIQPLFAQNTRAWITVWAAALVLSLLGSVAFTIKRDGSLIAFLARPETPALFGVVTLLLAWSALGVWNYRALFHRTVNVVVFVGVSWALIAWIGALSRGFVFLDHIAVLQAFIFLPFAWALAALVVITVLGVGVSFVDSGRILNELANMAFEGGQLKGWVMWWNAVTTLAVGFGMGAVILYIHRVNVESAARQNLIEQLEAAQRDLAEREREAGIMAERGRLARDLHDTLAQGLTSVVTQLNAAELALGGDRANAERHLRRARDTARANLAEIRRLVWALRPAALENASFAQALGRVVDAWANETGVRANLTVTGDAVPLHAHAEVAMLRLLQEALSNVKRHARAGNVRVRLAFDRGFVVLDVHDDGVGFDPDAATAGAGLLGMRERAEALGGRVLLESEGDVARGTRVTAALPLREVAVAEGGVSV